MAGTSSAAALIYLLPLTKENRKEKKKDFTSKESRLNKNRKLPYIIVIR